MLSHAGTSLERASSGRPTLYLRLTWLCARRCNHSRPARRGCHIQHAGDSRWLEDAAAHGCSLALFPDLFYQSLLRQRQATSRLGIVAVVGLLLEVAGKLCNCVAFLVEGAVLGVVPMTYLPTTHKYYEERWFSSSRDCPADVVDFDGHRIPFGVDVLFTAQNLPHCILGIETCEDLWATSPPSGSMALAGATLFLNSSASDEVLGKAEYRRALVMHQSAQCLAGYVYAGSGPGESTTDVVFGGHCLIAENGILLAETPRFQFSRQMALADLDLAQLTHERTTNCSFSSALPTRAYR
jgi:NAD+ synthase (glutamine-hydrolysing)